MKDIKIFAGQQQLFSQQKENSGRPVTQTLFDMPLPLSRRTDPISSAEAERRLKISGRWNNQKLMVLRALEKHPGVTSAELSVAMDAKDRYLCSRRLPDLLKEGKVRKGPIRTCAVCGVGCVTWTVEGSSS